MPVQIAVQDRNEAVNLLGVLLAYGTGFKKAGNVLAILGLEEKYNGNAKKMARQQAQRLATALGSDVGEEVEDFIADYNPRTRRWEGTRTGGSGDVGAINL